MLIAGIKTRAEIEWEEEEEEMVKKAHQREADNSERGRILNQKQRDTPRSKNPICPAPEGPQHKSSISSKM